MAAERSFFTDGAAYERMMGRWSALAGEVFLDWLAQKKGLRWLDVGCGTGAFTELLVARCAPGEVEGVDPSASQIAYASSRPGTRVAHFRQGDAQALPFADDSFDVAVMALAIAFVPDPAKAVAEMARVVRPGGWLAAYMWDLPGGGAPGEPIYAAMRSMGLTPELPPSAAFSRRDDMRALWERAGLQLIEARGIRVPITYADFDDFWNSNNVPVGPAGRAIHAMSPSAREQLKARLREQLPKDPGGRIAYTAHANAVKGQVPR